MVPGRTAILIAETDGAVAPFGAAGWFEATISAIENHTVDPAVYVADDGKRPGERLQRAYEKARADGAHHVVLVGPGVIPARDDWLERMTDVVQADGAAAAAASRACICTTVGFIEAHGLRFDGRMSRSPIAAVVEHAVASGRVVHDFEPSNRNSLRNFPGALYGDIVWATDLIDSAVSEQERQLLVDHQDDFFDWVRGPQLDGRLCFVLGMHRSGTSLLTAALEQCGVFLGKTLRAPVLDQPRGNFERVDTLAINDAMLAAAGGSWRTPPNGPITGDGHARSRIADVVSELQTGAPGGVKDPRLLLTSEAWFAVADRPLVVGTFRHPNAVARSLWSRDRIPAEEAHRLWNRYNRALVDLHRELGFPIVEFDLSNAVGYGRAVSAVAGELGLRPAFHDVMAVLAPKGTVAIVEGSAPEICQETYEYLRRHRYRRPPDDSFVAMLAAWEEAQPPDPALVPRRDLRAGLYTVGPHLPRVVRRALWRILRLRKVGSTAR